MCRIIILGILVIVTLSLSLPLGTEPYQISNTETYTLTDNRIIEYKGDFCQDLRATSTLDPINQEASASLYFFKSRPPLTDRESFNVSESAQLNSYLNYHNWNFYLNAGSNTAFRVCYKPDTTYRDVKYLLIKGTTNFNTWLNDTKDSHAVYFSNLTELCQTFPYQVEKDDMYYFVFYLSSHHTTELDVEFHFDRTLYNILQDLVVSNCSFPLDGHSSCAISAPISSGYTALLSLNASPPIDYSNDGGEIHISCQPRAWMYIVIVFAVAAAFSFCVIFAWKSNSALNRSSNPTSSNITTTFVKPSTIGYSSLPEYGSTPSAPPPPFS